MLPEWRRFPLLRARLLTLALAACAARVVDQCSAERRPWLVDDRWAVMDDGMRLPLRVWRPSGETVAAVVALHGFGDYSHAFEEFGPVMAEAGVAVFASDQLCLGRGGRGGGWRSEERRVGEGWVSPCRSGGVPAQ